MLRSSCLPSDSRASHVVCVGVILGTGSPKDSFRAKRQCFGSKFCNKVVKPPHFVVMEPEGVVSHKGFSALIFVK